jgi:hypothetical protein
VFCFSFFRRFPSSLSITAKTKLVYSVGVLFQCLRARADGLTLLKEWAVSAFLKVCNCVLGNGTVTGPSMQEDDRFHE